MSKFWRPRTLIILLSVLTSVIATYAVLNRVNRDGWCSTSGFEKLRTRNFSETQTIDLLFERTSKDRTAVFAHRGGFTCDEIDQASENSIANINKAIRMGFDGYETDLFRTRDGVFVIHHDDMLNRTTTGSGLIEEASLEELQNLRLRYSSGRVTKDKIPTLSQMLTTGGENILFLVELKGSTPLYFLDLVKIMETTDSSDQVLFWITWRKELVELFDQHMKSGVEEVRKNVVWRVNSQQQLDDIINRFHPRLIDLPLLPPEGWSDETVAELYPSEHAELVESALQYPVRVMASRLSTIPYIDSLYDQGVRIFMFRKPEQQFLHLIESNRHF